MCGTKQEERRLKGVLGDTPDSTATSSQIPAQSTLQPELQAPALMNISGVPDSANIEVRTNVDASEGAVRVNLELDWKKIVKRKKDKIETREDHINRHRTPDNLRETHGVFYGEPIDMVNRAWGLRNLCTPLSDGIGGTIYNIPFKNAGYESGKTRTNEQMHFITIITMEGTADLITAFPSFGDYHK